MYMILKEDEYSWNEVGRRKAKKNSYIRWLIMIVSFVILFIAAYLEFRYDLLEINGFLCWLLAILVFSWGFTICYASYVRKHACKMSLEGSYYDFNLVSGPSQILEKSDSGKSGASE